MLNAQENNIENLDNIVLDHKVPIPSPGLIHTSINIMKKDRSFIETKNKPYFNNSTLLEILDIDLFGMIYEQNEANKCNHLTEKETPSSLKKDTTDVSESFHIDLQLVEEISYVDILRDSFYIVQRETNYEHPESKEIEVECVYELFPHKNDNKYDLMALHFENFDENLDDCKEIGVLGYKKKVPSEVYTHQGIFDAIPLDISEYLFLEFEDNKAYFRPIGANLKLKEKKQKIVVSKEESEGNINSTI